LCRTSPEFGSVGGDVYAASAVRVSLELAHQRLVLQVPNGNVAVAAAAEAHLRVGTDGERVARRRRRGQLGLDARRGRRQVPDGQVARLPTHDQRPTVRQQLHRADVVVPLLQKNSKISTKY